MSNIEKIRQEIERLKIDYLNRSYTFVPATMEQLLDFIDSLPEESENHGCGVEFPHFGANYPDAKCIDGYLWDMDSYEDGVYTIGGDDPCPFCNTEKWLKDVLDDEIFKTRDEALEYVRMLKSKYTHKDSLPEEKHTCKTCGFYENNCPFIRGKLIPYPNKVCKDYTYSIMKEQKMKEQKPSEDRIKEEADNYLYGDDVKPYYYDSDCGKNLYTSDDIRYSFKAGAEWMVDYMEGMGNNV